MFSRCRNMFKNFSVSGGEAIVLVLTVVSIIIEYLQLVYS